METGIQVSSLKPLLKTPEQVRRAFETMAALGCRYVQLQWIDPAVPVEDIAAAMGEFALKSLGTQDFYVLVAENPDYYVNLNAATGGTWVTVSRDAAVGWGLAEQETWEGDPYLCLEEALAWLKAEIQNP